MGLKKNNIWHRKERQRFLEAVEKKNLICSDLSCSPCIVDLVEQIRNNDLFSDVLKYGERLSRVEKQRRYYTALTVLGLAGCYILGLVYYAFSAGGAAVAMYSLAAALIILLVALLIMPTVHFREFKEKVYTPLAKAAAGSSLATFRLERSKESGKATEMFKSGSVLKSTSGELNMVGQTEAFRKSVRVCKYTEQGLGFVTEKKKIFHGKHYVLQYKKETAEKWEPILYVTHKGSFYQGYHVDDDLRDTGKILFDKNIGGERYEILLRQGCMISEKQLCFIVTLIKEENEKSGLPLSLVLTPTTVELYVSTQAKQEGRQGFDLFRQGLSNINPYLYPIDFSVVVREYFALDVLWKFLFGLSKQPPKGGNINAVAEE